VKKFYVYVTATGEILRYGSAPEVEEQQGPGETAVEGEAHPDTDYVRDGEVTPRPSVPSPEGAVYDLTLLPPETVVMVTNESGETLTLTDMTEPLTLSDPGRYRFHIVPPFPFLILTTEIEVT
jgi:hypothetical protein